MLCVYVLFLEFFCSEYFTKEKQHNKLKLKKKKSFITLIQIAILFWMIVIEFYAV